MGEIPTDEARFDRRRGSSARAKKRRSNNFAPAPLVSHPPPVLREQEREREGRRGGPGMKRQSERI